MSNLFKNRWSMKTGGEKPYLSSPKIRIRMKLKTKAWIAAGTTAAAAPVALLTLGPDWGPFVALAAFLSIPFAFGAVIIMSSRSTYTDLMSVYNYYNLSAMRRDLDQIAQNSTFNNLKK